MNAEAQETTGQTTVLIVDDHDLIRKGLRHAFDRDPEFEVVGEADTAADALRQPLRSCRRW